MNILIRGVLMLAPVLLASALPLSPAAAQGAIYRCHSLTGTLIFQDKPCDQVATTREAREGSAGELVPAAAAPASGDDSGPDLAERYRRVLETQNLERQSGASSAPSGPQVTIVPSTGVRQPASSPAPETYSGYGYSGYSEGVYPAAPYYPPYRYNERRPSSGDTAASYDPRTPQALPKPLPAPTIQTIPGLAQSPPPGSRDSGPGHVVSRDPNANTR